MLIEGLNLLVMPHHEQPAQDGLVDGFQAPELFLDQAFDHEDDKPQDECGVVAVYAPGEPVGAITYNLLKETQHRGQSGAGMVYPFYPIKTLIGHRGIGHVDDAIPETMPNRVDNVDAIASPNLAIGHVRYSTAERDNAPQPCMGPKSEIALAHNGHLEGIDAIAEMYGIDPTNAESDSYLLTKVIDEVAASSSLDTALADVLPHLEGAYCLTISDGKRIIGARDPWGFHPLALGALPENKGYVLASESVAFKQVGARFVRDIEPGEIVSIDSDGVHSSRIDRVEEPKECMFEYVYIARPDGSINGVEVMRARQKMGEKLAQDHPVDVDIIVGVPDSGLDAAQGYAEAAGIPFRPRALIRNPYVQRTFIEREGKRDVALASKMRPVESEIAGKRVGLSDDSLVKGNTMRKLVGMMREAGATEVHVRLSAPHYKYACYMGMDTRQTWRLIAKHKTDEEIAAEIGADSVHFNTIERVVEAINEARTGTAAKIGGVCTACADGKYPFNGTAFMGIPEVPTKVPELLPIAV